jgi:hypothetical protein
VSSDFYHQSIAPFAPIIIVDVNTGYRHVFRKLDEMVAEMEELRR